MNASAPDIDHGAGSAEIAYAIAIGQACREAIAKLDECYVIDEVVRAKVVGLVVRIAKNRLRAGLYVSDASDVETIALLATRHVLSLKSAAE